MKAIKVDWSEVNSETWELVSQEEAINLLGRDKKSLTTKEKSLRKKLIESLGVDEKNKDLEDAPVSNEFGVPIYNYAYPLSKGKPFTREEVLSVALETNCCVVKNIEDGDYFLSLTGCGMDLSQDIGYAYVLLGERIPVETALDINTQKGLSISEKKFKVLAKEVIKSLRYARLDANAKIKAYRQAVRGGKHGKN